MLSILLVSDEDKCRSRIAQELLQAFGRGMAVTTAGLTDGALVPEVVVEAMAEEGYELSRRKAVGVRQFENQEWGVVITLTAEAKKYLQEHPMDARRTMNFEFEDVLSTAHGNVEQQMKNLEKLYDEMHRALFRYYRNELSELVLPACSCGANTYCRCE